MAKVFAYKGFVSSSRHRPKWEFVAITQLWDSSLLMCSQLQNGQSRHRICCVCMCAEFRFHINSSPHIGHGSHIRDEQNSHNCGRIHFIKTCKMPFFAWIYVDTDGYTATALFIPFRLKADNKCKCTPERWTWNVNTNIPYANSICSHTLFSLADRFFMFCLRFNFPMLNHSERSNTRPTKSTIQLYLKQYRLIEVCKTIEMETTVSAKKKKKERKNANQTVW